MTIDLPRIATRCSSCGRRSVIEGHCSECGDESHLRQIAVSPVDADDTNHSLFPSESQTLTEMQPTPALAFGLSRNRRTGFSPSSEEICGRVIIVRQAPHEPMDFDPWRWLAIPFWAMSLLTTPCVMAVVVWQNYGLLAALASALVSLIIIRFIFSNRLLQSWHFIAALNGRHIVEPMPVLMARLRIADEDEIQLRLKGHLRGGFLMEGDRIRATGSWRREVLHVKAVVCERTGASIHPHQPNARSLAMTGLGILVTSILWLYFAGSPWVKNEIGRYRNSIPQPIFQTNIESELP